MKLAYREYGQGQALLILHGLFGQSDNWTTLAKQFSEHGYRVFTIDLRNHGLSPHSEEWNYSIMAEDIHEFIQEHHLREVILLGHSMGGKVALHYELLFPGELSKLIIADIAPRYYPPHHQSVIQALEAVDFNVIHTRKEAEAVLLQHLNDYGTRQFLLKNLYWKDNGHLDWRFNLPVISRKIESVGEDIPFFTSRVPTLVLSGGLSKYVNEDDLDEFRKRFSDLSTVSIPGAGHWLHAEKPGDFYTAVMNFIKD